ncbi:MAG: hypothetical protein ACNS63_11775 [Candidatus Nitrospinota bacterium M3_3B_026]
MTAFHPRCGWRGAAAAVAMTAVFLSPFSSRPAAAGDEEDGGSPGRGAGVRLRIIKVISTEEGEGVEAPRLEQAFGKIRLTAFDTISEESMGVAERMLAPDEELAPLVRISPRVLKRKRVVVKVWKPWARALMYNLTWGGYIYDFYNRQSWEGGEGFERNMLGLRLNVSTKSFIWRPWFALVDGGVGLYASRTAGRNIAGYTSNTLLGDLGLSVFPYSRFPFQANYSRNRTDQGGDLRDTRTETERYSARQNYRTRGGTNFSGGYLHTDVKTENLQAGGSSENNTTRSVLDTFDFSASKSIEDHSLGLNSTYNKSKRVDITRDYNTLSVIGRHRYTPRGSFSLENEANYYNYYERAVTGYKAGAEEFIWDQDIYQVTSNTYWRPEDKPLTVNAGLRYYGTDTGRSSSRTGGAPSNFLANGSVYAGANYSVNENTNVYGTANYSKPLEPPTDSYIANQSFGVTYSADPVDFLKMDYTWGNQAGMSHSMSDRSNSLRLMETIRHGLQKGFDIGESSSIDISVDESFSLDHYANAAHGFYETPEPRTRETITHAASISWLMSGMWGRGVVRLSGSDNRSRGVMEGGEVVSQFVYFQASLDRRLSKYSLVYVDWVTQYSDSNLNDNDSIGGRVRSHGLAQYKNSRLFGVGGLSFQSSFRVEGRSYFPGIESEEESSETISWVNNLDYSIGRLQTAAMYSIVQTVAGRRDILMLRISRNFGN